MVKDLALIGDYKVQGAEKLCKYWNCNIDLLSSEKRTLDHWVTVQFFFSLAQVRRLWRQL